LLDEDRALEPPDPFPNSEVKRRIADGSVGSPHVRVGHRQALNTKKPQSLTRLGFFLPGEKWAGLYTKDTGSIFRAPLGGSVELYQFMHV
jgi:hypothetical protein